MTGVRVRALMPSDVDDVVALWQEVGLTRPWNDPRAHIVRARRVWSDLLLVAADGSEIVGSVMAGYDGHRGWLYYLASSPSRRGEGIGSALVSEAEQRLAALGCPKVQLMVRSENVDVLSFYDSLDYQRSDVSVAGKRLVSEEQKSQGRYGAASG